MGRDGLGLGRVFKCSGLDTWRGRFLGGTARPACPAEREKWEKGDSNPGIAEGVHTTSKDLDGETAGARSTGEA